MSLCYINHLTKEQPILKPKILIISASPDTSSQYIPLMNCIFSAQKKSVPIDSCILSNQDSSFFQQASHITGGIYLKPQHQAGLLQYLLSYFIADNFSRRFLFMPVQSKVDFRASCFCHKRIIDVGFVCSVCLSIFCTFIPVCSTCKAKFPITKPLMAPRTKK